MSKQVFLPVFVRKVVCDTIKGFVDPKDAERYAGSSNPSGLEQASRNRNICFDGVIKAFRFIQCLLETCIYKKVSGSTTTFLISICG